MFDHAALGNAQWEKYQVGVCDIRKSHAIIMASNVKKGADLFKDCLRSTLLASHCAYINSSSDPCSEHSKTCCVREHRPRYLEPCTSSTPDLWQRRKARRSLRLATPTRLILWHIQCDIVNLLRISLSQVLLKYDKSDWQHW